jgi:ABC-type amino acid transport substrate-binding protein
MPQRKTRGDDAKHRQEHRQANNCYFTVVALKKGMHKTLTWIGVIAVSLFSALSLAEIPNPIKVGSELDFFPYAFVNEKGQADGFSVDLVNAVAKAEGLVLEIKPEPWDKIWNDLVQRRIDLLPLVGKLDERATVIEFSLPHTGTSDAFFVREGMAPIPSVTAAKGKQIVVMRSDVAHHKLLEYKFQGEIITVNTISDGLNLIASGKYDAFLGPLLMGALAIKDQNIKHVTAGEPVPDYLRIQAFAVKKGDMELLAKLNHGLETIKSNGEYNRIYNKWLTIDNSTDTLMGSLFAVILTIALLALAGLAFLLNRLMRKNRTGELRAKP